MNDTTINQDGTSGWRVVPTTLTDGSEVHDVVAQSKVARVTLHCVDEDAAIALCDLLNDYAHVSGATAEPL